MKNRLLAVGCLATLPVFVAQTTSTALAPAATAVTERALLNQLLCGLPQRKDEEGWTAVGLGHHAR